MRGIRLLLMVGFILIANYADLRPANAFMEKVGQDSINQALDRLQSMQNKLVQDIFDDGNKLIEKLINDASNERKSAIIQMGSEFHYAVTGLTNQFGSEIRKTASEASAELKNNLAVLLAWTGSIEDVTEKRFRSRGRLCDRHRGTSICFKVLQHSASIWNKYIAG
jgi:hypothetical protein